MDISPDQVIPVVAHSQSGNVGPNLSDNRVVSNVTNTEVNDINYMVNTDDMNNTPVNPVVNTHDMNRRSVDNMINMYERNNRPVNSMVNTHDMNNRPADTMANTRNWNNRTAYTMANTHNRNNRTAYIPNAQDNVIGNSPDEIDIILGPPPSYEESENMHRAQISPPPYSTRVQPGLLPTPRQVSIGHQHQPQHFMHRQNIRNFLRQRHPNDQSPQFLPRGIRCPQQQVMPFILPQEINTPRLLFQGGPPINRFQIQMPVRQHFIQHLSVQNINIQPNSNNISPSNVPLSGNQSSVTGCQRVRASFTGDNQVRESFTGNQQVGGPDLIGDTRVPTSSRESSHNNMPPGYTEVPPAEHRGQTLQNIAEYFCHLNPECNQSSDLSSEINQIINRPVEQESNTIESSCSIIEHPEENAITCEETNSLHSEDTGNRIEENVPQNEPICDMDEALEVLSDIPCSTSRISHSNSPIKEDEKEEAQHDLTNNEHADTPHDLTHSQSKPSSESKEVSQEICTRTSQMGNNESSPGWNQKKSSKRWSVTKKAKSNLIELLKLNNIKNDFFHGEKGEENESRTTSVITPQVAVAKSVETTTNDNIEETASKTNSTAADKCGNKDLSLDEDIMSSKSTNENDDIIIKDTPQLTDSGASENKENNEKSVNDNKHKENSTITEDEDINTITQMENQDTKTNIQSTLPSKYQNKNRALYAPMENLIGSLLQMTLIDCDETITQTLPNKDFREITDASKIPKSRLLNFIENGIGNQRTKLFPRETFGNLF